MGYKQSRFEFECVMCKGMGLCIGFGREQRLEARKHGYLYIT